jgi:hypothetical protein
MDGKIFGMEKKTFVIFLSIAGGLLFTWASGQISGFPPDMVTPYKMVLANHRAIAFYHVLQVIGVIAAIYGGVNIYKYYKQ